MTARIKAVTFDLWETLIIDESDEPKRRAQGLRPKPEERRHLVWEALNRHGAISQDEVSLAYDVADAAFIKVWKEHSITWTIGERLAVLLKGLGRDLAADELAPVVRQHEEMEVVIPPDPIAGVAEALETLAGRYKLCVVSDTIVTPGTCLRKLLATHDLERFFGGFAFSDEVGRSKPHPGMFESAARQMGVELAEMVHIGDREHNDIKGAHALGLKAVLFTAARDVDLPGNTADAVCADFRELPAIIDGLAG